MWQEKEQQQGTSICSQKVFFLLLIREQKWLKNNFCTDIAERQILPPVLPGHNATGPDSKPLKDMK